MRSTIVLLASVAAASTLHAYSSGPPDGYSGGPGEATCAVCHASYELNTGPGTLAIAGPAWYAPGQTYALTVTLQQDGQARWGFQFSPMGAGTCTITDPATTQASSSGGNTYVSHTASGTYAGTPGPASWTFEWTAPLDPPPTITFYATGNAADDDGSPLGDYIYATTFTMGLVPVELARFGASWERGVVVLRWRTLSERDNAGFRIFRDGAGPTVLVSPRLIPGAGTSSVPRDYCHVDPDVSFGQTYTYRLMEVSLAGRESFVASASLTVPPLAQRLAISPRVVLGEERLSIWSSGAEAVEIVDVAGRVVAVLTAPAPGEPLVWDLRDGQGARVRSGAYLCRTSGRHEGPAVPFVVLR